MQENGWNRIRLRLRELRRHQRDASSVSQPHAIKLLKRVLRATTDRGARVTIMTMLANECSFYGLQEEEEKILIEMTNMFPDEPLPWISWASFCIMEKEDLDRGQAITEIAIEKAREAGRFVRHALTTRARLASKQGDYSLLEDTLEILSNYRPPDGSEDIGYEQDFLQSLPADAVNETILQKYREAIRSQTAGPIKF